MPYNTDDGIISAPVAMSDVQHILGEGSNDLGTLCRSSRINMWSRHKPVGYRRIGPIGFGDSDGANEAKTVNYGLTAPAVKSGGSSIEESDITDMFEDETGIYDWKYTRPTGGTAQPYRLSDFKSYSHYAVPFIICNVGASYNINRARNNGVVRFSVSADPGNSQYNLQSYDFNGAATDLSLWKLAVMIGGEFDYSSYPITDPDSGSFVDFILPRTFDGSTHPMYMFLFRVNNGLYEYMKIPQYGTYNRFPIPVSVYYDASSGGGGVPDARDNVWIQPEYSQSLAWHVLEDVLEDSFLTTTRYGFRNSSGELCLKMKMQNTHSTVATFYPSSFTAFNVESGVDTTPEMMLVSDTQSGSYTDVTASGFSVPTGTASNPGIKYVILVFRQKNGTPFMRGTSGAEEVLFRINGHQEFYETIYYQRGTAGWYVAQQ